ncbi:MAG: rubrerythrin family protein [Archaeoglobales archaeon]|nr:rubrerythrin family protein [Archaeoglobales archaeon]
MSTLENLVKAFIGESMARNRYTFYAKIAKEEGYVFLQKVFLETAENEREHATQLFKFIQMLKKTESVEVVAEAPLTLGNTIENLKSAIKGENYENTKMYPEFANEAEKEGYEEIAKTLRAIAKAEEHHERRYLRLLEEIEKGTFFKRDKETVWVCLECGYVHIGKEPPEECPSCKHSKAYYVAQDLMNL